MVDDIPNVPPVAGMSEEERDRIKRELGLIASGDDSSSESEESFQPITPRRHRGRPRKYHYDETGKPTKVPLESTKDDREEFGTLPSPALTTRDSKEVANRLKGILIGSTKIGAVLNPAIEMTEKEAENISTPLTAYLVRTEATSKLAHRVLDEYDLTAFVIATLAYMVRVVKDVRSERQSNGTDQSSQSRRILQRTPTSGRVVEPEIESALPQTNGENEEGQERPISRDWASVTTESRRPSEV